MEGNCSTEMFQGEEFECAECDYKAATETEMRDHSEMHRGEEGEMIDFREDIPGKDSNKNILTEPVFVSIKNACERVKESDACRGSPTTMQGIQKSCFSSDSTNDHENMKRESDPLVLVLPTFPASDEDFRHQSHKYKSKDLKVFAIPGVIEVDNTGKYIPDGWQRIVYQDPKRYGYSVMYMSPTGCRFYGKAQVSKHIKYLKKHGIKNPVDIEKMDFSVVSHKLPKIRKRNCRVEIELDNTNVYIPDGWKRKAFEYLNGGHRRVFYISPYSKEIGSKKDMKQYLMQLESREGYGLLIDIESLYFSLKSMSPEK